MKIEDTKCLQEGNGQEGPAAATGTDAGEKGGKRRPGLRYRVRRQDVRFMKRGGVAGTKGARQISDNKSELPLAANDASWQRFQTVE